MEGELGDGLMLRRASERDVEALVAFNGAAHADPPAFAVDRHAALWTRELMTRHPHARARDFTLVEDVRKGCVASSLCLLSHRVRYGAVELGAGQVELVGTRPEHRRRGLVAAQFGVAHARARDRDLLLIDGIPGYYRQFGYEMALENRGERRGPPAPIGDGDDTGLRVRPARVEDAAWLVRLRAAADRRHLVSCIRDEAFCRFEIAGRIPLSMRHRELRVIETREGEPVGILGLFPLLLEGRLIVSLAELAEGTSWTAATGCVLEAVRRAGEAHARRDGGRFAGASFRLGSAHPLYVAAGTRLDHGGPAYGWYVRVPDLPRLLRRVAPTLDANLTRSALAGHTGSLRIGLGRSGLQLRFEAGRLTRVEPWSPSTDEPSKAVFPGRSFLQLLFGHRSLAELEAFHADCVVSDDASRALLAAAFPPQSSWLDLSD